MLLTQAQVRTRIKTLTDSAADPVLADPADIDVLMAYATKVDLFGVIPDVHKEWAAGALNVPGDLIVPTGKYGDAWIPIVRNGFYYICTVGGVGGTVEPAWPVVIGQVVVDGASTWSCVGAAPWSPTYDIYYAVAQGWLLKAGRLAGHYNFMSGGKMFSREQFYNHCIALYRRYSAKSGVKSIRLGPHSPLSSSASVETSSSD